MTSTIMLTTADRPTDDLECDYCNNPIGHGETVGINWEHPLGEEYFCAKCLAFQVAELVEKDIIDSDPLLKNGLAGLRYDTNELFAWAMGEVTQVMATPDESLDHSGFDAYCAVWNKAFQMVDNHLNWRRFRVYDAGVFNKPTFVAGMAFLMDFSDEQESWLHNADFGDTFEGGFGDERGVKMERIADRTPADFS